MCQFVIHEIKTSFCQETSPSGLNFIIPAGVWRAAGEWQFCYPECKSFLPTRTADYPIVLALLPLAVFPESS